MYMGGGASEGTPYLRDVSKLRTPSFCLWLKVWRVIVKIERGRWEQEAQGFYNSIHSVMTDPGRHAVRLSELPRDIDALQRIANGLVIHFRLDDPMAVGISKDRLSETENRYAEVILDRLWELHPRSLVERR